MRRIWLRKIRISLISITTKTIECCQIPGLCVIIINIRKSPVAQLLPPVQEVHAQISPPGARGNPDRCTPSLVAYYQPNRIRTINSQSTSWEKHFSRFPELSWIRNDMQYPYYVGYSTMRGTVIVQSSRNLDLAEQYA